MNFYENSISKVKLKLGPLCDRKEGMLIFVCSTSLTDSFCSTAFYHADSIDSLTP